MSHRTIVGPLFTHAGFKSWFLVCEPQTVVAVPMGFWFAITGNKAATLFVGGATGALLGVSGSSAQTRAIDRLTHLNDYDLAHGKGHVTYKLIELSSIAFKRKLMSSSEIILTRRNGSKRVFGIMNAIDQPAIIKALSDVYGAKMKTA